MNLISSVKVSPFVRPAMVHSIRIKTSPSLVVVVQPPSQPYISLTYVKTSFSFIALLIFAPRNYSFKNLKPVKIFTLSPITKLKFYLSRMVFFLELVSKILYNSFIILKTKKSRPIPILTLYQNSIQSILQHIVVTIKLITFFISKLSLLKSVVSSLVHHFSRTLSRHII